MSVTYYITRNDEETEETVDLIEATTAYYDGATVKQVIEFEFREGRVSILLSVAVLW